jgi:hypothetical protein
LNTEIYTNLLAHPQKIGRDEIALLATVIEKYPYFQSARALQLKALKETNSFLYNDSLKRTAAHTTNRDILFEYITSNSFIQNNNSQDIVGHDPVTNEIDVTSKDVSKAVSIEIDAKIKEELKKAEAVLDPDLFERKINSISSIAQRSEEELKDTEASETSKKLTDLSSEDKKPLEFRKNDTHSFSEWLQLTKAKPIDRSDNVKISATSQKTATEISNTSNKRQRDEKLIEKFIQDKPKLISKGRSSNKKDIQQQSEIPATSYNQAPEALMTETLAKVYLQQKNYLKAIKAYEILILKYPEKSGFFADQIRAIEKLTNTEE